MKSEIIKVEMFNWTIQFIEVTSKKDTKPVIKALKGINMDKKSLRKTEDNIKTKSYNGGQCSWNVDYKKAIILLYPCRKKYRVGCLAHEIRHCADVILESCHINDRETAAYFTGYLTSKIR